MPLLRKPSLLLSLSLLESDHPHPDSTLTRAQCYTVLNACVDMSFGKPSSITVIRMAFSHQTDQANWSMLVTHQVVVKTVTSPTVYLHGGIWKAGSQMFL